MMTTGVTAKQARANYRRLRYQQNALTMNAPDFGADSMLPDIEGDELNMLKQPHGENRTVYVPFFDVDGSTGTVRVELLFNSQVIGTPRTFRLPLNRDTFPAEFTLSAEFTSSTGRNLLGYRATRLGNPRDSESLSFYVDTTPPNSGQTGRPLELPPEVEAGGVTREYLDANEGKVQVTIPAYRDAKPGDVAHVYANNQLVGTLTRDNPMDPMTIDWPEAAMSLEGEYTLVYTLTDRTGNINPRSTFKNVPVYLTAAPTALKPPKVPQFDDELIDLKDAQDGVGVQIDAYTNHTDRDQVAVYWGDTAIAPVPVSTFPVFVSVPYLIVRETPANTGPKQRKVTYRILRGEREFPESVGIELDIDLRVGGPDDPGIDPDPEEGNPALTRVTVKAANTTQPNKIGPEDNGEDATATVPLYAGAVSGEELHLLWDGKQVDTYVVTGSESPGDSATFTIPWANIEEAGNASALPVRYVVTNEDNENRNPSPVTYVEVTAIEYALPAATFSHLYNDPDEGPIINCSTLRDSPDGKGKVIEVFVAGGEDRLADQVLSFTYQGYQDDASKTPIPETKLEFKHTPTANEARVGFTVRVPYDPYVVKIRYGHAGIKYSAIINGLPAQSGEDVKLVYVELPGGGGETCPVTFRR